MPDWTRTMAEPRRIDLVVVHCSDSPFGDAALIDRWHRARGWRGIGYHYVILNGYPDRESYARRRPKFWLDGVVENGRPLDRIGAHVRGHNRNSVGVCLIGRSQFTQQQFGSLVGIIDELKKDHHGLEIAGHYELLRPADAPRTCPNIDMDWLRGLVGC